MITNEICRIIHNSIHNGDNVVNINGINLPITIASNGCRKIKYEEVIFMQQNLAKNSEYAMKARNGEHITWGIRNSNWIYIDDKTIRL